MLRFMKAALILAALCCVQEAYSAPPDTADQQLSRAGSSLIQSAERGYREGSLTKYEKDLLVADINAFLVGYRDYSATASQTHLYLKSRAEREIHYKNKIAHISSRLRNLADNPHRLLEDLTEDLSDFVPMERRCGRPLVHSCMLREVEGQTALIHANINRWSMRYREKFRSVATKGLHVAELYSRVVASFRAIYRRAYSVEYLLTKDRMISAVREEIEMGY